MEQLRDIIERFIAVRDERRALERQAEELKRGEETDLKNRILMRMHEQGMKTINFAMDSNSIKLAQKYKLFV